MTRTSANLYRAIIDGSSISNPDSREEPSVDGALYPRLEAETHLDRNGREWTRRADMTVFVMGEETIVDCDGGTVLFDQTGWYGFIGWRYFDLPEGTVIPDSLVVERSRRVLTSRDGRRHGRRYVIVPRGRMSLPAYRAALDNLARNAVVRKTELAR